MTVLCVTPNPAVDRTLIVPGFRADGVWRAEAVSVGIGGKGVNVARALRRLGVRSLCAGLLGGDGGRVAADHADREGMAADWTWVSGDTRTCVFIIAGDGRTTVLNEPGPRIAAADWDRLVATASRLAEGADTIAISGSLPPGCPEDGLSRLVAGVAAGGRRRVWLDTSGVALRRAAVVAPFGIKINGEEASDLVERPVRTVADAAGAARCLLDRGASRVAVTLGGDGAVLVTEDGAWHARPPAISAVNAVGSGDSFLAGLIAADRTGADAAASLRRATACEAANALAIGIATWPEGAVDGLTPQTTVRALDP